MPTEDDLRDLFASSDAPRGLDSTRVIARSRARRRPRQVVVGALGTLAVVGIAVVGIQSFLPRPMSTMSEADGGAAPSPQSNQLLDSKRAPADKLNLCGAPVAEPAPSFYGLALDVVFPASAPVGTTPIIGTVRLTNSGSQAVTGTTAAAPAITLSQGGIVLWHSNGPMIDLAVAVDLAPGQSQEYQASFTPVRCAAEDDEGEGFRSDLPAVSAGDYELSAAIDFLPDPSMIQLPTPGLDLVTGPRSPVRLG